MIVCVRVFVLLLCCLCCCYMFPLLCCGSCSEDKRPRVGCLGRGIKVICISWEGGLLQWPIGYLDTTLHMARSWTWKALGCQRSPWSLGCGYCLSLSASCLGLCCVCQRQPRQTQPDKHSDRREELRSRGTEKLRN